MWRRGRREAPPEAAGPPPLKSAETRRGGGGRSRCRRGRPAGGSGKVRGGRARSPEPLVLLQGRGYRRCWRPARPRVLLSLRPVNVLGRRAPGMRAPRNTNQFLMREKYQLLHLRSDSLGTESSSGGSDCEMEPLDMDSYLGVLENARGALMDCAAACPPAGAAAPGPPQDESQPYFPSEDDVMQSERFMERDFDDFCSRIA